MGITNGLIDSCESVPCDLALLPPLSSPLTQFTGHLLCAFLLRRHLMVWKIFAPRLVFSFCGLGVVLITTLVVRCLVVCRLHAAVIEMRRRMLTNPDA